MATMAAAGADQTYEEHTTPRKLAGTHALVPAAFIFCLPRYTSNELDWKQGNPGSEYTSYTDGMPASQAVAQPDAPQ